MSEPDFDDYDDFDADCWNCGGEGFVSHCFTEYACMYPDEGCELCMRPCEFCAAVAQVGTHPKGGDGTAPALLSDAVAEGHAPSPSDPTIPNNPTSSMGERP